MTSTLAQIIQDTRTTRLTTSRPQALNKLSANITDSETPLVTTYALKGITADSKISIGLEDMHVWSVTEGTKSVEVERAQYGSTAAAHTAADIIHVNPLYSDNQILRAINQVIGDLSGEGLFQIASKELTADTSVSAYDLAPTNMLEVYDVWTQSTSSGTKHWERLPTNGWEVQRDAETDVFASGIALFVRSPIYNGQQLRVTYKQELSGTLAAVDDVVETVTGLESEALDLLSIGAALHLLAGKEVDRSETNSQRSSRRSQEVPSGAWSGATRNLERLYDRRLKTERQRLRDRYPERLRGL